MNRSIFFGVGNLSDDHQLIHFGHRIDALKEEPISLQRDKLLRHMVALGASGSGKTVASKVLVEEMGRLGVPAICIDPQGDICSLALRGEGAGDSDDALQFYENVEVVIFTPGSTSGIQLCADPINNDPSGLDQADQLHVVSNTAAMLTSLLGYSLDSDDGEGVIAVFDKLLSDLVARGCYPGRLQELTDSFAALDEAELESLTDYIEHNKLQGLLRRMRRLERGSRSLMFHEGHSIDIDMLLGTGSYATASNKTRLSVVYLNALQTQEDKEFFVAALTEKLYSWMLKNPSNVAQALFYIDEVAPYLPPVKKPASKPGLQMLFKQARKYGVVCLMATQNPGDIDYKSLSQFGSWMLGRLTTKQDIKKVFPMIKSLAPDHADVISERLPSLTAGQFLILSPDHFSEPAHVMVRWLYTEHETLDEERITEVCTASLRAYFDGMIARNGGEIMDETLPEHLPREELRFPKQADLEETSSDNSNAFVEASESQAIDESIGNEITRFGQVQEELSHVSTDAKEEEALSNLENSSSMTAGEYASMTKKSDGQARSSLKRLVSVGLAKQYKDGRVYRFYSVRKGLRPDIGLTDPVESLVPTFSEFQASAIGREQQAGKKLGFLGRNERFLGVRLFYKVLLQLEYTEVLEKKFYKRILGPKTEQRRDTVYLHPLTLQFVTFRPGKGVRLVDNPGRLATKIPDFDGVTSTELVMPGNVSFEEDDWVQRVPECRVFKEFSHLFNARPIALMPFLMPAWEVQMLIPSTQQTRILTLDGLVGKRLDW